MGEAVKRYPLSYAERHDPSDPPDDPPDLTEDEQAEADDARQWAAENEHENREHAKNNPQP